jgi:hypothetical protein
MAETSGALGVQSRRNTDPDLDASDSLDCTITLSREHPDDCGQRQVFVRLDEDKRAVLVFGQSVTLEVEPGVHVLRVHNTLVRKRIEFTIEPGEHLGFTLINRAPRWAAGMAGILGWAPLFLTVRKSSLQ